MSDLIFNLRVWYWHFQIGRNWPWLRFGRNEWRWQRGEFKPRVQIH